ncbi:uncharacterized protein PRCAT00000653001 [Priceomyces carsonii]|uniref:uncharacterized protein n=1 Tax=Priceomyces carsonii TaxID=28549 RepID=UPI002EDA41C5|nr:unnamed protein product [Priceomyces carsonii]
MPVSKTNLFRTSSSTDQSFSKYIKNNKYKVLPETKTRNKRTKDDESKYTQEIELLYKLFVPTNFLVKNDKLSVKQLMNHLPNLIPSDSTLNYRQLNFELHMFLSSIMTNFVLSWYFGKLNTENMEFVLAVYQQLIVVVKDMNERILLALKDSNLVILIDELSEILNQHLIDIMSPIDDEYDIRIISINRDRLIHDMENERAIIGDFLSRGHIIFRDSSIRDDEQSDSGDTKRPDNLVVYFRALSQSILEATFVSSMLDSSFGPLNSEILQNFIIAILSDLVFQKVFQKISSPDFVCTSVVESLAAKFSDQKTNAAPSTSTGMLGSFSSIKGFVKNITGVISALLSPTDHLPSINILDNSFFNLCDTLLGFSNKKPLLYGIIMFTHRRILANLTFANKLDSFFRVFTSNLITESLVVSDASLAESLKLLRQSIFQETESTPQEQSQKKSLEELSKSIQSGFQEGILSSWVINYMLNVVLRYENESNDSIQKAIYKFLMVFNYNPDSPNNDMINDSSDLNKLLLIKVLDCVIAALYPELDYK